MKDLSAVVETYIDKDGQKKAKHMKIGALGVSPSNKEYILLDASVNLAGVLLKQNLLALEEGRNVNKNVMINVFDNSQNNQQSNNGQQTQNQQQQGYAPQNNQNQQATKPTNQENFEVDSDIPF